MSQISKNFSPAAPIGTAGASFFLPKLYNKAQKFSLAPSAHYIKQITQYILKKNDEFCS